MSYKITVDYDVCASTGACMQFCPEVFEVRSDGFLYVLNDQPPRIVAFRGGSGCRHVPDGSDQCDGALAPAQRSRGHFRRHLDV